MNFNGEELTKIPENIASSLIDENIPLNFQELLGSLKIPDLGGLAQSFQQLLPQNLVSVDIEGVFSLLSPKELQQQIEDGLQSVRGLIEDQVKSVLDEAMSLKAQATDAIQQAGDAIENIGTSIASLNFDFLSNITDSFTSIAGTLGIDTTSISQIQEAATPVLDGLKSLSPKQIRDLQNPATLQQTVNTAVDTASQLMGNQAIAGALQSISPSLNIQAIQQLFGVGAGLFAVGSTGQNNEPQKEYSILVEINTYYAKGEGADVDAAQYKSVSGKKLQPGKSCAVDNSSIIFDSDVETSLGTFKAVDKVKTGTSSGTPVISLFFDTQEEAVNKELQLTRSKRRKQVVKVKPPGSTFVPKQLETRGTSFELI